MRAHLEELGYVETELESLEVSVPIEDMEGLGLQNLIFMLRSKQYLLNRIVGREHFFVHDDFIKTLQTNLPESKEAIIEILQVEGTEVISGLRVEDDKVTFSFPASENPEKNRAYVELVAMMVAHAREAKRISPKASEPENEKYYLRVWLVRIGLGGKGAKGSRKALLEGLKGHTAFRTPEDAEKHKARLLEKKEGDGHEQ
ncbi:phage terminase small subunit P27 family [Alkaliphilus transvaalensis]|uniref:phage terminase small subunit P27 family n=1 Tax=Alkaliphilus transvaalensis TaxID=114628 RepID=UPI001FA77785|nr:phage terminase small subunit P27 family [Alkaliphilus transvaalensis]